MWADDAKKMVDMGIRQVRVGEFAWSRIEPAQGQFDWGWLDRAIDVLGAHNLSVTLGTPTATPPKWLIDLHPDILACDASGRPRKFGSRRHYCFSSERYREEAARITELMASRYGQHEAVNCWQTDNEYGCHNTTRSYSDAAKKAFRIWLSQRYGNIDALNTAWETVFWSQEYQGFDAVDLPMLTVTEPHPAHVLDFYRFSSDQVVRFNKMLCDILWRHAPGRDIVHNYMGFYFEFDHFKVAEDLDAVGWDSYPIGFLDVEPFSQADKTEYMRQGHPDFAGFYHDLYRACGRGRWHIAEQQPGPVNWASSNPVPLDGMVRLWTLEGVAHGAEFVSYFRWRQAPFAQEQMHAGLMRPDNAPSTAAGEAALSAIDINKLSGALETQSAKVAIVFSYEASWLFEAQPHNPNWSYTRLVFDWYSALRRLGLNVDFISPDMSHDDYAVIIAPSLPILSVEFVERAKISSAHYVFGPRTGSKTQHFSIPENLPPGPLQRLLPVKVTQVDSLPNGFTFKGDYGGQAVQSTAWLDHIESQLVPTAKTDEGHGLLYSQGRFSYFTTVPDADFLAQTLKAILKTADLSVKSMPEGLRLRQLGEITFAFNYSATPTELPRDVTPEDTQFLIGARQLEPAGVAAWQTGEE